MTSTDGGDGFGGDFDGTGSRGGAGGLGACEAQGKSPRIASIGKLFKRPAATAVENMSELEVTAL